uniref:DNA-repair protein XRCC4 n=1 Tax=Rhizophora mucronata TaxID=61149 RepID=A0A2P2JW00_RHIMU
MTYIITRKITIRGQRLKNKNGKGMKLLPWHSRMYRQLSGATNCVKLLFCHDFYLLGQLVTGLQFSLELLPRLSQSSLPPSKLSVLSVDSSSCSSGFP